METMHIYAVWPTNEHYYEIMWRRKRSKKTKKENQEKYRIWWRRNEIELKKQNFYWFYYVLSFGIDKIEFSNECASSNDPNRIHVLFLLYFCFLLPSLSIFPCSPILSSIYSFLCFYSFCSIRIDSITFAWYCFQWCGCFFFASSSSS